MHAAAATAAAAGSAMETNKVLHFVPSGKWTGAAAQLSTTQRSPGEPRGSLPLKPENPPPPPPLKTCAAHVQRHLQRHRGGRQMFGCACACVRSTLFLERKAVFLLLLLLLSGGVVGFFFPSLTTRSLFFFLFCSLFTCGMRHQRLLHRIS